METRELTGSTSVGRSRRGFLTRAGVLAAGAALMPIAPVRTMAQEGTPTAGGGLLALGTPISFISVEGLEVAKITINAVTDPFTGYNPAYPPPRGNRFLLVSLKAENVGPNPFGFDPNRIFLQDTEGFVIYPSGVDLGPEPVEPAIGGYQDVPAAATVSGVLGYVLIKGVTPTRIFYSPSSDRLVLLADLA